MISEACEDANCPAPIYLNARRLVEGRLREIVEEKPSDLGTPRRQGVSVFVDEGGVGRTTTMLDEGRVLVETSRLHVCVELFVAHSDRFMFGDASGSSGW